MKKISLATSIFIALAAQAFAEPGQEGEKWVGGFGEYYSTDQEKSGFPNYLSDAKGLGAEFGFRFKPEWAARFEFSHLDVNASPLGRDASANRFGVDAMYFLPDDLLYVFGGVRHMHMVNSSNLVDFGLGKHWDINGKWKVITEVASYMDLDDGYNDLGLKLGVAYTFGESTPTLPKDSDKDGVNDTLDMCPNTVPGTRVDAKGCDIDEDKDGVLNSLDLCPNTPIGTTVDSNGCAVGSDEDKDGVIDAKDKCPNTPTTDKVDEVGCSVFMEKEVSQTLKLTFAQDSAVIVNHTKDFQAFADFMNRFPNTDTVIEGHASAPGTEDYNMMLSKKRADAVRELLITKYGIEAARITSVGYGETQLLDTANTDAAHAKNRRIMAKVSASKRVKVEK